MGLRGALRSRPQVEERYSLDQLLSDVQTFGFGGSTYGVGFSWSQTSKTADLPVNLGSYVHALMGCPPAFAAQLVRGELMAQVELVITGKRGTTDAGKIVAEVSPELEAFALAGGLERMEWHAGIAGAAYITRTSTGLRLLQPDRTTVVIGSNRHREDPRYALDAQIAGLFYEEAPGKYTTILPGEFVQWVPIPDPLNPWRGMSWLTPVIREMQGDRLATEHKLKFFENAGTPNLVFSVDKTVTPEQLKAFKQATDDATVGVKNAYTNLYLGGGADVTVVGADLKQLDFANTQATGENRIAVASRVPASILGIKEGLQGSTLNAGNFGQARRSMADTWLFSQLKSLCSALDALVPSGTGRKLWYDPNLPFLREDAKDAAEIQFTNAQAMRQLVEAGYDQASARDAVIAGDLSKLEPTGFVSVQLQPLGGPQDPNAPTDGQQQSEASSGELTVLEKATAVQKVYLGVGKVVTAKEGRDILREGGIALDAADDNTLPTLSETGTPLTTVEQEPRFVVNLPEQQITVEAPNVTVEPAQVTVERSDTHVDVHIPQQAPTRKTVTRDANGQIAEIVEDHG